MTNDQVIAAQLRYARLEGSATGYCRNPNYGKELREWLNSLPGTQPIGSSGLRKTNQE